MEVEQNKTEGQDQVPEPVLEASEPVESKQETKERLQGSSFYKQKLADLEAKNIALSKKIEERETESLKARENYKGLYELERQKREASEAKALKVSQDYLEGLKVSAVESEAIKNGILDVALSDVRNLELDMVEVETTSHGRNNIIGAKEFVENLKEVRPHWFNKTGAPKFNSGNPSEAPAPKKLTADELVKLQKTDPEKYRSEMEKRLNIA